MSDKYDLENLPISDKTKQEMTLTSGDLHAIKRVLDLWDNANEERFEEVTKSLCEISTSLKRLGKEFRELRKVLTDTRKTVDELKEAS